MLQGVGIKKLFKCGFTRKSQPTLPPLNYDFNGYLSLINAESADGFNYSFVN